MERIVSVNEALELMPESILLDVRSPSEYARGHIPGAYSLPLFSNEERAEVGTLYKQKGKEQAFLRGLEIVGPKMAGFVRRTKELNHHRKKIVVHCWRGGQRSKSMAWLLAQTGMQVNVVQGGYKAFRHVILQYLDAIEHRLLVVGGSTGSGKTHIINELVHLNEQVIDLEGLAHHKGSAFGWIGEKDQPSTEHFENKLAFELRKFDINKRIWVENESKGIGRVYIPVRFREKMKETALFQYELALEARLDILVDVYTKNTEESFRIKRDQDLIASFDRIATKLGGVAYQQAKDSVHSGDYREAARIALVYYDKTYGHSLDVNPTPLVVSVPAQYFDAQLAAKAMIEKANELSL
jgi:tRNA 2-selenouridine synthase